MVALLIAGLVLVGQKWVDDSRAERDREIAASQDNQAQRLENLRFVRDRSSIGYQVRPFAGLDLQGMNMAGLRLDGSDFKRSDLSNTDMTSTRLSDISGEDVARAIYPSGAPNGTVSSIDTDLRGAKLCGAKLRGTDLVKANLSRVNFGTADLSFAILAAADLSGADLSHANLITTVFTLPDMEVGPNPPLPRGIYYDEATIWPVGFAPPPRLEEDAGRQLGSIFEQDVTGAIRRPNCP